MFAKVKSRFIFVLDYVLRLIFAIQRLAISENETLTNVCIVHMVAMLDLKDTEFEFDFAPSGGIGKKYVRTQATYEWGFGDLLKGNLVVPRRLTGDSPATSPHSLLGLWSPVPTDWAAIAIKQSAVG